MVKKPFYKKPEWFIPIIISILLAIFFGSKYIINIDNDNTTIKGPNLQGDFRGADITIENIDATELKDEMREGFKNMVAICTSYFDNLTCQKGEYMEIESPTECKNNPTFISRSEAYFDECDIFYAEFNEDKDFNEGNIYFEFNVNFTSIPDPNYFIDIFSKNNSENRLSIFIAPTGDLVFKTYTPNRNIEVKKNLAHKGMGFGTNEWHSVMYEWDLKEQYIWVYIDGVLVLEMELPDTSFQNKFDVYTIGADWMVRNQAYATIRAVEITNSKRLGYLPIAPKLYIHKRFNFGD